MLWLSDRVGSKTCRTCALEKSVPRESIEMGDAKPKEKIRRHLPPGTGNYSVGCVDIMCDHTENGSFFRLFYPIEKTDVYVSKIF